MKSLVVIYVSIGHLDPSEIDSVMAKVIANCTLDKDQYDTFFVPIRSGETRVECINPIFVSEDEYDNAKRQLASIESYVSDNINLK